MKTFLNVLDIISLIENIKPLLKNSFVKNIYNSDFGIIFSFKKGDEKFDLIIDIKGWIFLTEYEIERKEITEFIKEIRNFIVRKKLVEIKVPYFDRLIEISFEENYKLYIEMMHGGNIILTKDGKILSAYRYISQKKRKIKKQEKYILPEIISFNPLKNKIENYLNKFLNSKAGIVATLLKFFGIPTEISEEVCFLLNIDFNALPKNLSENKIKILDSLIKEKINEYIKGNKPCIILDKDYQYLTVVNSELKKYQNKEKIYFKNFNKAVEEYFIKFKKEEIKKMLEIKKLEEKKKTKRIIDRLEKSINETKIKIEILKEFANKFSEKISEINLIFNKIKEKVEERKWKEIGEFLKYEWKEIGEFLKIDLKKKTYDIKYKNIIITLNLLLNSYKNLENIYNEIKKLKEKVKVMETKKEELIKKSQTLKLIREIEIKTKEKKKWYENYLWFISSNDFLVIGGKDSSQNESLIKKRVENKDVILHADIHGSPFLIIKTNGREVPNEDLLEAAQFVVSYSSGWKQGFRILDAYWIKPEQISKKAPSGTYLPKGSFMIYGKKNFLRNIPLCIAICIEKINEKNKLIILPKLTAERKRKNHITLIPGNYDKEKIVEKIIRKFIEKNEKIKFKEAKEFLIQSLPKGNYDLA